MISRLIEWLGGHVASQVSGATNFLLLGHILEDGRAVEQSLKYKNAINKGTKMMTEDQLAKELEQLTGQTFEELLNETHS